MARVFSGKPRFTKQGWRDVAYMVDHYRKCTDWVDQQEHRSSHSPGHISDIERRRELASRITDVID